LAASADCHATSATTLALILGQLLREVLHIGNKVSGGTGDILQIGLVYVGAIMRSFGPRPLRSRVLGDFYRLDAPFQSMLF
jgi:hypothetical protein